MGRIGTSCCFVPLLAPTTSSLVGGFTLSKPALVPLPRLAETFKSAIYLFYKETFWLFCVYDAVWHSFALFCGLVFTLGLFELLKGLVKQKEFNFV
ncbi:hypothetical protein SLA2020_255180 [Shorea laevis]